MINCRYWTLLRGKATVARQFRVGRVESMMLRRDVGIPYRYPQVRVGRVKALNTLLYPKE